MPDSPNVFLAAGMRTGSTHIKNCLIRLGLRPASTHITLDDNVNEEHMVDGRAATLLFPMGGFVFQQHVRAIGRNVPLLREYGIRPIVLYRNIYDCVLSWTEQATRDWTMGKRQHTYSPLHIPDWGSLGDGDRLRWVAYNVVPWYFSFYVSWQEAEIEKMFISYERFFEDQPAGLRGILRFSGFYPLPDQRSLEAAAAPLGGKFSVGLSGRGAGLPGEVKRIIEKQAEAWGPQWSNRLL